MAPTVLEAIAKLHAGEVIGLPTETVYGLAADATNPEAVARIFSIKGRPAGHPLILHLGETDWLERYCARVPERAFRLAAAFWPGPLSMVLFRNRDTVPDEVTGGLDTVAVRVPAHPVAREVLLGLNRPVAAPSANRFGAVSPTTREHVLSDLGDDVSLVLEGGCSDVGLESTIVDLTRSEPRLLRPGKIDRGQLETVLGVPVLGDDGNSNAAPGTLASHYAPRAVVELCPTAESLKERARSLVHAGEKVGVILANETSVDFPARVLVADLSANSALLAHDLYAVLRRFDEAGCSRILSEVPTPSGLGEAALDRLERAASPR